MAQVLKNEVRDKIVSSARDEFLEHGYEDSSMRRIAFRSKMTVGNLYRYFRNKEELNVFIVGDTFDAINALVRSLTHDQVDMGSEEVFFHASVEELQDMMDKLSDGLLDIYLRHDKEVNILMMNSKLNERITTWFTRLISGFIHAQYSIGDEAMVKAISHGYAVAVFAGIRDIFRKGELNEKQLRTVVKIYLNSYLAMLRQDLDKYLKEN